MSPLAPTTKPAARVARGTLLALACATAVLGCSKTEAPASASAPTSTAAPAAGGASTTGKAGAPAGVSTTSGGGAAGDERDTEFCKIALQAEKDADTFDPATDAEGYLVTFKTTISDLTKVSPDELKDDMNLINDAVQKFDTFEQLMDVGTNPELKAANDHLSTYTSEHCGA